MLDYIIQSIRKNENRLIFINLVISFYFWLIFISTVQIHSFLPNAFYYMNHLNFFYWIGLFISIICTVWIIIKKNMHWSLFQSCCILTLFVLYLFGTPCFIYDTIRFTDANFVTSDIEKLINIGNTDIGGIGYLHEHPGLYFFATIISILCTISPFYIGKYFLIYLMLMLSLTVFIIAWTFSKKYAILSGIAYLSLCWTQEYHISPQAFTLILYGFLWLLLFFFIFKNNSKNIFISIIIISATIIFSHPGTPIFIILNITLLFSIIFILSYFKKNYFGYYFILLSLLFFTIILYNLWIFNISHGVMQIFIDLIKRFLENLDNTRYSSLPHVFPANPQYDYDLVNKIRVFMSIIEFGIAAGCILGLLLMKKIKESIFFGVWFFSCFIYGLYSLFIGGLHFGRSYIFALFPFSILVILFIEFMQSGNLFQNNFIKILKTLIIVFIAIAVLLIPLTHYSGDCSEYYPESTIIGEKTFQLYSVKDEKYESYLQITFNNYQIKQQKGRDYIIKFSGSNKIKIYNSDSLQKYLLV